MLVRIANGEDPDQSDLGLHCFSWTFWTATSVHNVHNFRTYNLYGLDVFSLLILIRRVNDKTGIFLFGVLRG